MSIQPAYKSDPPRSRGQDEMEWAETGLGEECLYGSRLRGNQGRLESLQTDASLTPCEGGRKRGWVDAS